MGYPQANRTMANVHGVDHVVGGSLPSMIWHDFMAEAVKEVPPLPFTAAAPLPSRAELEATAKVAAQKRLTERQGFDLPPARQPEDLPPGGSLWAPAPKPAAKEPPPPPAIRASPSSTAPPPPSPAQPRPQPPPESSTTTTSPPSSRRPPPRGPLPVPIPGG
jgi:membrane peptidoglycan carboxypeptidase